MDLESDNYYFNVIRTPLRLPYEPDFSYNDSVSRNNPSHIQSTVNFQNQSITIDLENENNDPCHECENPVSIKGNSLNPNIDHSSVIKLANPTEISSINDNITSKAVMPIPSAPKIQSYQQSQGFSNFSRSCCVSTAKPKVQNVPNSFSASVVGLQSNFNGNLRTYRNQRNVTDITGLNATSSQSDLYCESCRRMFPSSRSLQIHCGRMHKLPKKQKKSDTLSDGNTQLLSQNDDMALRNVSTSSPTYPPLKLSITKVGSIQNHIYKAIPIKCGGKNRGTKKEAALKMNGPPDDETLQLVEKARSTMHEIKKMKVSEALPLVRRLKQNISHMKAPAFASFMKALMEPWNKPYCFNASSHLSSDSRSSNGKSPLSFQTSSAQTRVSFAECNSDTENEALSGCSCDLMS